MGGGGGSGIRGEWHQRGVALEGSGIRGGGIRGEWEG